MHHPSSQGVMHRPYPQDVMHHPLLKGTVSRDFDPPFFSENKNPKAPDYRVKTFLLLVKFSLTYLCFSKFYRCATHRTIKFTGVQHTGQSVLPVCYSPLIHTKNPPKLNTQCVTRLAVSITGVLHTGHSVFSYLKTNISAKTKSKVKIFYPQ